MEQKARGLLPLTEATYLILASLAEPRHGYAVMQEVAGVSGGRVQLGPGTLYGALTHLLSQGLIARSGEEGGAGERRKVYALTPLGRKVVLYESERVVAMAQIARLSIKKLGGA